MLYKTTKQMTIFNKNTKKYDGVRALVVKQLAQRYGVTETFVRQALRKARQSATALMICADFKELYKEVAATLNGK